MNPFQYTGRENDGNGLYYYRARYYSTVLGRFLQEDPSELEGIAAHRYVYVLNNPVRFIDPRGLVTTDPVEIAEPWQNTIICDGDGGIIIQVPQTFIQIGCGAECAIALWSTRTTTSTMHGP